MKGINICTKDGELYNKLDFNVVYSKSWKKCRFWPLSGKASLSIGWWYIESVILEGTVTLKSCYFTALNN